MKKEVNNIVTEVPIMLESISITRLRSRSRNAEVWMIDGITNDGKPAACIGFVSVIYREKPDNHHICGSIRDIYDIDISETKMLWDILYHELHVNLRIEDADCFFTWRSGTVDQSWTKPSMFYPVDTDDPEATACQHSEQSDIQMPSASPESPSEFMDCNAMGPAVSQTQPSSSKSD